MITKAPLKRRSSSYEAAQYIRELIFSGELRPGERIPQDQVAAALEISRIPVREALIALENEGWVSIELHRGAFVNALTENIVRDHYQLYGMLYAFCVERAMKRSKTALAEVLPTLAAEFGRAATPEEADKVAVRFADVVIDGAQSPRTRTILKAMSRLIPGSLFVIVPGTIDVERAGLQKVAKAVRAGDGARAGSAYREMMDKLGELCVAEFASRGLFDHNVATDRAR